MDRIRCFNLGLTLATMLATGCATSKYPNTLNVDSPVNVKFIGIVDEISTPTTLSTRTTNAGGGGLLGALVAAGVEADRQKTFTTQVRDTLDFQAFAEVTLLESFAKAVKSRPGWSLVSSNEIYKADAAFLLEVTDMGVDQPRSAGIFKLVYQPTITVTATLIGTPPFEIMGTKGNDVQVADPTNHPVLYRRVECVSHLKGCKLKSSAANNFVKVNGFTGMFTYSGDPELFKVAYREAIELAVKRIAASWVSVKASK